MDVKMRVYLSRMAEKIEQNKTYAEKLGTKNRSELKYKEKFEISVKKDIF